MTIFSSKINKQIEDKLKEKVLAGKMALKSNGNGDRNESIMYTLQTLEYIKRMYLRGDIDSYEDYIEDGKFNDKVQYLIKNSPPAINPELINVPIEELPSRIIEQYKELMDIKEVDDYLLIDPREVIKEHLTNSQDYGFYNNNNNFKYLINEEYNLGRGNLPTQPIHSLLGNIDELYQARERVNRDYLKENTIKVKKDELNFNAFMYLYEVYYFDLYMRTFYAKEMDTFKRFKTINFVDIETEGAISFDELAQYTTDIGNLQYYVGLTYYQYRLESANEPARRSMSCNLNNRKLNDIGFVFEDTSERIIDIDSIRIVAINTMYDRRINGHSIEYSYSTESMLEDLPEEDFNLLSENFERVLGITDPYNFEYLTDAVMSNINQAIYDFTQRRDPVNSDSEDVEEKFGYLAYGAELENLIDGTISKLENKLEQLKVESE